MNVGRRLQIKLFVWTYKEEIDVRVGPARAYLSSIFGKHASVVVRLCVDRTRRTPEKRFGRRVQSCTVLRTHALKNRLILTQHVARQQNQNRACNSHNRTPKPS